MLLVLVSVSVSECTSEEVQQKRHKKYRSSVSFRLFFSMFLFETCSSISWSTTTKHFLSSLLTSPEARNSIDQEVGTFSSHGQRSSPNSTSRSKPTSPSLEHDPPLEDKAKHPLVELFVGDLSYFCTEEQLRELFGNFGHVVEARIRRSERGGHSLMHGFVKMTSLDDAQRSANALDNKMYMGRRLR